LVGIVASEWKRTRPEVRGVWKGFAQRKKVYWSGRGPKEGDLQILMTAERQTLGKKKALRIGGGRIAKE